MPISDEFTSEINAAIEQTAAEQVAAEVAETEKAEAKAGATEAGRPAPETVVELEDDEPKTDVATKPAGDDGDKGGDDDEIELVDEGPKTAPSTQPPAIGDEVLAQAVEAGISLADARQFSNEQSLLNVIASVKALRQESEKKPEEKSADEDPLAGLPKLDPEAYEPEVIKTFETLVGVVREQQEAIKAFRAQSEQAARSGQESAAREVEQWFDEQVKSLGNDFSDALGTGDYGALDRGSPQFAKREAIADQVAVLLAGYKAAGKQTPPRDDVFDAAARLVLSDEFQELHNKKLAGDLAKRSTQHISRAGGQKAKKHQSPLDETAAMLDEKFFSKG